MSADRASGHAPQPATAWQTLNAFVASPALGGLTDFAELYLEFNHENVTSYERRLDLDHALSTVHYECDGVAYDRECFISNPDRVLAMRLTASKKGALRFTYRPTVPYVRNYGNEAGDGGGRTCSVRCMGNTAVLWGQMNCYRLQYAIYTRIVGDGEITDCGDGIAVKDASDVTLYFCTDTNYKLSPSVFTEQDDLKKLPYEDVRPRVEGMLNAGSMIAGLLVGAGVGLLVLFRVNDNVKENFKITLMLYVIGVISGIIIETAGLIF